MAVKTGDAYVRIYADDKDLDKGFDSARQKTNSFASVMQGILQGVGQRLFTGIVNGLETVVSKMNDAVTASSDLAESTNKIGVLFGENAQQVLDFADTADTALGQSKQQALDAAATFGTFGKAAGLSGQELVKFATDFDGLASDLASFNNTTPEQAIAAIGAALRGESEPIRQYGILLDDATLRQKALELGIVSTTANALTPQQRVLAAQVAIYEQTSAAQGDFARTSEGLANAQRVLAAEIENGSARLGDSFRPAIESITNLLVGLAPQMFGYAQNITDQLANGLAAGIRSLLPVIMTIRQLFTYWFAPGSPPRVLPDIDKWGAAAMQEFLGGFSSVDVKAAFDTVGKAIEGILRSNVAAGKSDENGLVGAVFGTRDAIQRAVAEFASAGSVSEATINKITRAAGAAGPGIANLVKAYFNLQTATTAATRAQDDLNRITDEYDAILTPLQGKLDSVRAEQRRLADQQRLIAAQNTLTNFDSTAAEKRAAQLEIEQISLESQIDTVEQQKKAETDKAQAQLDGAKKQEDAAKKQLDIAQATIDQQVEVNNLLAEQKRLTEQLAAAREADAKKAESEAEQAANKAKQQAEQAERLADQLHDAQLRYNLELSDTPGKIKLMQDELGRTQVGSVEYFNILTQIHSLQEQYNHELEQAAKKAGALGATDISAGLQAGVTAPLGEASKAGENLAKALQEAFAPIGSANEKTQALADKISVLVDKIGLLFGIDFSSWSTKTTEATGLASDGFALYGEKAVEANSSVGVSTDAMVDKITRSVDILTALVNGDWTTLWNLWKETALTQSGELYTGAQDDINKIQYAIDLFKYTANLTWSSYFSDLKLIWDTGMNKVGAGFNTALGSITTSITNFGKSMYDGGANLIDDFWDGLKSKWSQLSSWFTSSLAGLRAQLPFSEPKDPTSPLRGLAKSGESMVNMIQGGIDKASFSVAPLANSLLSAGATTNDNRTSNNITITIPAITINGNADAATVRGAINNGLGDALRASGIIT